MKTLKLEMISEEDYILFTIRRNTHPKIVEDTGKVKTIKEVQKALFEVCKRINF